MNRYTAFMQFRFFSLFSFICLLTLTGCADAPKPRGKPIPDLNYAHLEKLSARGMGAQITTSYLDTGTYDPNVRIAIPLPVLMERHLNQRFWIKSDTAGFTVDVEDLKIERQLVSDGSFGGLLGGDERTTLSAVLVFRPNNFSGALDKIYTLSAKRNLTINANMSLADRELAEIELLESFIGDLDQKILELFAPKMR
ncbi:MAG: hypothetical protein AAF988_06860 [Pseudomonadota bacterium]